MKASVHLDITGEGRHQGHVSWGYPVHNHAFETLGIIGPRTRYTLLNLRCMRERFNAQVSNGHTKSAITMDSPSDASMRCSVRWGTIHKSFWNALCSFLALHLRGIRQPEINKMRLEWTGKWVSLPWSPHPHPYGVYHPQPMLAYYTWHALFYRNIIHSVLRDLPHGWAGMIWSIENGWQDYGLTVFSSLQAWEHWLGHYAQ